MNNDFEYIQIQPDKALSDYVESFWCLHNRTDSNKETIGLPDGRIDLSLFESATTSFRISLLGVATQRHDHATIPAHGLLFAVSFKLLAVEYLFHEPIADILNSGKHLPNDYWDFDSDDLKDFDRFCKKASKKIYSLLPETIDARKQKLFELIYVTNGAITVKEFSEKIGWSSRQINRYFNHQFGLSLNAFCKILRFRASLDHIAKGKLFPEMNFADQTHFIKEIKKFSGVVPKELFKNKNDRFILLSTLSSK